MKIEWIAIGILFLFYFCVSVRFTLKLKKSEFFSGGRKIFHTVMIWLFPFVWIFILRSFLKPTAGSHQIQKKNSDGFNDSTSDWVVWAASASSEKKDP